MKSIKYRTRNIVEGRWADHNEQMSEVNVGATVNPPSVLTIGSDEYDLQLKFPYNDKNDKPVFVGDVIEVLYHGFRVWNAVVKFGEYEQDASAGEYGGTKCYGFYAEAINKDQLDEDEIKIISDYNETTSLFEFDTYKVIGNIYDNPELLQQP